MQNNEFGINIVRLRKKMGLTQKELAERLHVSDKAVSRWETGKNYPDVETLLRLAVVFDVQVGELLQGDLTLKKKKHFGKKDLVIAILIVFLLYMFPFYHLAEVCNTNVFGVQEASHMLFRGMPTEHMAVSHIVDTAEDAFTELGLSEEEAYEKYGELGRYCITSDYDDVVKEKHRLRIWSVSLNNYTAEALGCIWVFYSQEGLTKDGKISTGSWKIPAIWYLDKDENGEWYVTGIKEAP